MTINDIIKQIKLHTKQLNALRDTVDQFASTALVQNTYAALSEQISEILTTLESIDDRLKALENLVNTYHP
jgi:archaellum component FlaC